MIDKKGEKSIDMAIGALSVSSELNDKNNTPIIAKGQFDVLSMDANLGIRDEGFEVGANMNIVSASGNIGLSIGTKEMEVRLSIGGLLGPIFGFLELLSSASIEQNKYQIVQYNQRKAFLNSAKYEIQRIEKLKKSIKEKELQIEIQYLRFLEKQIRLLKNEIQLNNERERQQRAEILYSFSQYDTGGATYKDRRNDFSSSSYHKIDYYQIFKETL